MGPRPEHRPALLAALVALVLYAVTVGGTYVYDDVYIAKIDPRLAGIHRWDDYFTQAYFPGAPDRLFRPLTSMTFAVQRWLAAGDVPWPMHLFNVALNAATCAAVAELARRLSAGSARVAYAAGLLFAVHPVHVEAVAYLVGRAELMCTLGMVGGMILFLGGPMTGRRALGVWGCMVGAVLSKEQGMLLPAMLLACLPVRRATLGRPEVERPAMRGLVLLLCWSLAAYVVFREQFTVDGIRVFKFSWDTAFVDWTINPLVIASPVDRWLIPFSILGRYVVLLAAPWRLAIDYSGWTGPAHDWGDPYFYLGLATVVAWWVALAVAVRRRAWAAVAGLVCLVLAYSMVSNFGILIGTNIGERLMYLPSVFFVFLVALAVARVAATRARVTLVAVLVLLGSVRTVTYAWRWNDALGLYTRGVAEQPRSVRQWMLILDELREAGRFEDAAGAAAEARALRPDYWRIWFYSAIIAEERGRYDEAIAYLDHAATLPRSGPASIATLRGRILERKARQPASTTRAVIGD